MVCQLKESHSEGQNGKTLWMKSVLLDTCNKSSWSPFCKFPNFCNLKTQNSLSFLLYIFWKIFESDFNTKNIGIWIQIWVQIVNYLTNMNPDTTPWHSANSYSNLGSSSMDLDLDIELFFQIRFASKSVLLNPYHHICIRL